MKVIAVKPSPSGHFRYRLAPRLVEEVLCGNVRRINVPLRHAGPVRTAATEGFQVVERHLYAQSEGKRLVAFFPTRRLGLLARESDFKDGRSVPSAEPIRYARPGGHPEENPYIQSMKPRDPTDLRAWSTRLWGQVKNAERASVQDLSAREMRESGARLDGLSFHPWRSGLFERAFRGMWDRAWASRGLPYESNPAVMSLRICAKGRSSPACVSQEVSRNTQNVQGAEVL